jgi:26S proteasome regulatory subunit N5
LAVGVVTLCFEARQLKQLNENLVLISKRRGQLKTAVQKMVQAAMEFVERLEGAEKRSLIDTLIEITEGKIYVEVEGARLTRTLAHIQEKEGDVAAAAATLRAVQVETFGAMDRIEKTDYILEQMRLCLDAADFIRAQIISNKINRKFLNDKDEAIQRLKLRFYALLVRYHAHSNAWLDIARAYQSAYVTPIVTADESQRCAALRLLAVHAVLTPHGNEQADILARISADPVLEDISAFKALVQFFSTPELVRWPRIKELYAAELAALPGFGADGPKWAVLQQRIIEHNVRVVAKYYARVRLPRLAQLLDLSANDAEKHVADLVVAGAIYARIDRPAGIVSFVGGQTSPDLLNTWSHSIAELLGVVENTCHLVAKERMLFNVD